MADEKTTPSDGKPNHDKTPITNPQVDVAVDAPKDSKGKKGKLDSNYADKVKRSLEGEVRKAIEKGAREGSKKQLENAGEQVKKAADQIDPNKISKVRVRVSGDVGGEPLEKTIAEPTKQG